jgi:hypothetical protein
MADKTKVDKLYEIMGAVVKISEEIYPYLRPGELTEIRPIADSFKEVLEDPESRAGFESYLDEVIDEGIRLGTTALEDMQMNLIKCKIRDTSPLVASLIQG